MHHTTWLTVHAANQWSPDSRELIADGETLDEVSLRRIEIADRGQGVGQLLSRECERENGTKGSHGLDRQVEWSADIR